MNTKGKILAVIILVIIVIICFFIFRKKDEVTPITNPTPITSTSTPQEIVVKISLMKSDARVATFKSDTSLLDVNADNIRVFTQSASVSNSGEQADFPDEDFLVTYDSKNNTIVVKDIGSEVRKENPNFGAFQTNCAACTHEVEFIDLKTVDGSMIPKIQISIY